MSRSRGLPSPTSITPLSQVLDTLTDPGTPGTSDVSGDRGNSAEREDAATSVTRGTAGTSDNAGTSATSDDLGTRDSLGDRGNSVNTGTSGSRGTSDNLGTSPERKLAPRDHVKLRRDLAAEMRDAVWFLTEHGRPRVQLGELLDEAVEGWLADAKKTHNGGDHFPHRGRLR